MYNRIEKLVFQSLFYWKLLWKIITNYYQYFVFNVSILVLLEIALEAVYAPVTPSILVSFQSLFYWKLLWKFTIVREPLEARTGFNPCSIGNCSGSFLKYSYFSRPDTEFQSLFYWKLLWKTDSQNLPF